MIGPGTIPAQQTRSMIDPGLNPDEPPRNCGKEPKALNNPTGRILAHARAALTVIAMICIALRVAAVIWMPRDYDLLSRDPDGYGHLASRLAEGLSYSLPGSDVPSAYSPPLYPLVLAPLYAAGLGDTPAPLLLAALLDALTCLALYALVRRMGGSLRAALLAALFWALYLPQAVLAVRLWTEPLAALLATALLWALTAGMRGGGRFRFILGGAFLGLGALARSTLLPLGIAAAAAAAFASSGGLRPRIGRLALALLACALIMLPWVVRNAASLGAFIPTTTHGGRTIYEGNCGLDDENFLRNIHAAEARERFERLLLERDGLHLRDLSEVERDRLYRAETIRIILRRPARYALLSLNRFARFWFNVGYGVKTPSRASFAVCALHAALLAALAAGLLRGGGRHMRTFAPALAMVVGATLLHMATIAYARYAFPFVPALLAMLAVAWAGTEE